MPEFLQAMWQLAIQITTPLLVYQISVTVFVCFSLINAITDWFTFRTPLSHKEAVLGLGAYPALSVLIPARNEENNIASCIESLLAANYPGTLEILVLDDRSEDRTGEIVRAIAAKDERVKCIAGSELLPGWKGKPNALRQLADAATGEMLLLTDADCIFEPGSLTAAIAHRERTNADCLSLMPYLVCGTFWEQVILPLQYFIVFTTLPVRSVYASRNPAFAAANGAFILLPAATYRELGGHSAVKSEMAEDIKFAQYVKKSGLRLVYADGSRVYSVRMYESLRGIWDGFSKNLFPAMGSSLTVLTIWLVFHLATQILPLLFCTVAIICHNRSLAGFYLPLFHLLTALGIRFALSLRFRQAPWTTVFHPIGWCIVLTIAVNSAYLSLSGKGHTWKGRLYQSSG